MRKAKSARAASGLALSMVAVVGMTMNIARAAPEKTAVQGFEWRDGAEVYVKVCGYCHEGQVGPRILGRELPSAYTRSVVRNGNRAMPAFRPSEIDDESLAKLAEFIQRN